MDRGMRQNGLRLKVTAGFLILAAAGASPAKTASAPFTIDQIMSAPYPTSLTAALQGRQAAWVYDARGVRNIWIADAAGGRAHPITSFTGDDGYDVGDLSWSADARTIAFTRGQTLEDDAPANVASSPTGPSGREVWLVPATGGGAHKIGSGHSPNFSPDGKSLIFLDKHQILVTDMTGSGAPKPLLTDMGTIQSAVWSPDGRRLAFVSQRRTHALVGVYDTVAKTIVWQSAGFDFDGSPVFSPDGTHIAFIRVPTEKARGFIVTRREGEPWSIWVSDVRTGAGRQVWRAENGRGSIYHPALSETNLLWTAANRLVFAWERTGWLLPYSVDAGGGQAVPLATGEFEVAYLSLTPDRRKLIFSSNQNDIDRLHIWSVEPGQGRAVMLGGSDGIEAFPTPAADGSLFALRSTATQQLAPVVLRGDRWQQLAPEVLPAAFPTASLVTPQPVTFKAKDGQLVHGQLFLPRKLGPGPHPVVMFYHGGPIRQMLLGFHYMSAYSWMYALNEYFAAKGYIVLSTNYRGGIGYGLDYREAKDFGPQGGSEVNDILGGIEYLRSRPDVDPKRVGIWGGSYGGLMTALGLARAPDAFAAGVDYAGVYNWASMRATLSLPGSDGEARQRAIASSPVATIDQWRAPVLVVQADDDRNVPHQQSTELVQDLRERNIPHEELLMPNEVHDLTRYASWMTLFEATDAYFGRYLKP